MSSLLAFVFVTSLAAAQDFDNKSYGWGVAGIGDLDGDRVPDIAVTSVQHEDGGGLWIESGATGETLLRVQRPELTGSFGYSVAAVGDLDRDGKPDVAVGAPDFDGAQGCVVLVSGADGSDLTVLTGGSKCASFGATLAAGDLDRDGFAELIVGAPADDVAGSDAGAAWVFDGKTREVRHIVRGRVASGGFGASLALGGEVDSDNVGDVWVGAPYVPVHDKGGAGEVTLISGSSGRVLHTLTAEPTDGRFGISLCGLDDLDGDRVAEVAVGVDMACTARTRTGLVRILSVAKRETLREIRSDNIAHRETNNLCDRFGWSLARVADLDGDGVHELAIGAPNKNLGLIGTCGHGSVHSVVTGERLDESCWSPGDDFDLHLSGFGASVTDVGDLDGDGISEVAFGAPSKMWGGGVQIRSLKKRQIVREIGGSEDEGGPRRR